MLADQPVPLVSAKAVISHSQFQTTITAGKHSIIADEPEDMQGSDTAPSPTQLLLASLSSCTAITLQMYINSKMWIVNSVTVVLEMVTEANETFIKSKVEIDGELTADQKKRLHHIADVCPVHKILTGKVIIQTSLA